MVVLPNPLAAASRGGVGRGCMLEARHHLSSTLEYVRQLRGYEIIAGRAKVSVVHGARTSVQPAAKDVVCGSPHPWIY